MSERKLKGVVRYASIDGEYLQRRQLKKGANWVLLWGLGVGAVISGEFSGWNVGLASGGFWGLAIATVMMAVMYLCLVYSIAELSAALPYAGGFYSFARNAYGPFLGFIAGTVEAIEYILTPAVIVYFTGTYLSSIFPVVPEPIWWILLYALFVYINTLGVKTTLKVALGTTLVAMCVLLVFCLGVIFTGNFSPSNWFTTSVPAGVGMFKALPYAIWFYLAIEQIPLAAEEADNVVRDVPKSLTTALLNMAVAGAVISYAIVLASYIQLKLNRRSLPRPYQSPLGLPGAFVGIVLAVIALLACFADPNYQIAVLFVIAFLILAIAYFWFFRREALVAEAPEEQIALSQE